MGMELAIMIGAPGSGKTTFCKRKLSDTHIRLNLDMLGTRHRENILFRACLEAKQAVVIDNTNLTTRIRARFIGPAIQAGFYCIAYFMDVPLDWCRMMNDNRTGEQHIPDHAVISMYRQLEEPTYQEGFRGINVFGMEVNQETYEIITRP